MAVTRSTVAAVAILAACLAYAVATWDLHVMNFRVRVLCDEDVPFVNERRRGVEAVGVPAALARRDPLLVPALEAAYPSVVTFLPEARERPRYQVDERWPTDVSRSARYAIVRTELTLVDRARGLVLATGSVYEGRDRAGEALRRWRARLVPESARCLPSDRIDFVRDVLRAQ